MKRWMRTPVSGESIVKDDDMHNLLLDLESTLNRLGFRCWWWGDEMWIYIDKYGDGSLKEA